MGSFAGGGGGLASGSAPAALTGLDEVPWAGLTHAYGSAEDVPGLLRHLVSADAERREVAVDELFGSICHQGTIYDATGYAVPFLACIAADPALPSREDALDLLQAIGAGTGGDAQARRGLVYGAESDAELDAAEQAEQAWVARGRKAVADEVPRLLALLRDADPRVRLRVPCTLAVCHDRAAEAIAALVRHLDGEMDPAMSASVLLALAALSRDGGAHPPLPPLLEERLVDAPVSCLALGMLQATRATSDADLVSAMELMIGAAARGHRELAAVPGASGRGARMLTGVLDGRPAAAMRLVHGLTGSSDEELRASAVAEAGRLVRTWRSITPPGVRLLADALDDPAEEVRECAVTALAWAFPACRPAADALAWALGWAGRSRRYAAIALARLGDPRILPHLRQALDGDPPHWAGPALLGLGGRASQLLPDVLATLPRLPARPPDGGVDNRLIHLTLWVGTLGDAAAPAVPALAAMLAAGRAPLAAASALARLGAVAAPARPALVGALSAENYGFLRAHAAGALWATDRDPRPLLDLAHELPDELHGARWLVLEYLEGAGRAGEPLVPWLRMQLAHRDQWHRVPAARALWRITGDSTLVLPVLLDAAAPTEAGMLAVECLAEIGPVAPQILSRLREWLASDRRLGEMSSVDDIVQWDESFRAAAERALARITTAQS